MDRQNTGFDFIFQQLQGLSRTTISSSKADQTLEKIRNTRPEGNIHVILGRVFQLYSAKYDHLPRAQMTKNVGPQARIFALEWLQKWYPSMYVDIELADQHLETRYKRSIRSGRHPESDYNIFYTLVHTAASKLANTAPVFAEKASSHRKEVSALTSVPDGEKISDNDSEVSDFEGPNANLTETDEVTQSPDDTKSKSSPNPRKRNDRLKGFRARLEESDKRFDRMAHLMEKIVEDKVKPQLPVTVKAKTKDFSPKAKKDFDSPKPAKKSKAEVNAVNKLEELTQTVKDMQLKNAAQKAALDRHELLNRQKAAPPGLQPNYKDGVLEDKPTAPIPPKYQPLPLEKRTMTRAELQKSRMPSNDLLYTNDDTQTWRNRICDSCNKLGHDYYFCPFYDFLPPGNVVCGICQGRHTMPCLSPYPQLDLKMNIIPEPDNPILMQHRGENKGPGRPPRDDQKDWNDNRRDNRNNNQDRRYDDRDDRRPDTRRRGGNRRQDYDRQDNRRNDDRRNGDRRQDDDRRNPDRKFDDRRGKDDRDQKDSKIDPPRQDDRPST
jgi:hypothetical protein